MTRIVWGAAALAILIGIAIWRLFDPAPAPAGPQTAVLELPSGLTAEFHEMLWNEPGGGLIYRFRFVAPDFTNTQDVDTVMADLQYLCSEYALPKLATNSGPVPGQLVISLADKPSEFGTYDPGVIQVFEAFNVKSGSCIWEIF